MPTKKRQPTGNSAALSLVRKRQQQLNKKKRMDETAAAKVYEEFVASFEVAPPKSKPNLTLMTPKPIETSITPSKSTRRRKRKSVKNIDLFVQEIKLNAITRERERSGLLLANEEQFAEDPLSSNVLIDNLPPETTESSLVLEFGKFGPIGTVKLVDKTSDDSSCKASVNFMRRDDAKRCVAETSGKLLSRRKLIVSMGKRLPEPGYPIKLKPASESGDQHKVDLDSLSAENTLRVQIPSDGQLKCIIDAVASMVSKEGEFFERNVTELHRSDPNFAFLVKCGSPENLYFRWRVYSLAQGDELTQWRQEPFRVIEGGAVWVPPRPEAVASLNKEASRSASCLSARDRKKPVRFLPEKKRDTLESLLRPLTKDRNAIKEAMGFCIDNSENAVEIVETMTEALTIDETETGKKVARLYLVSDILHNSGSNVRNSSAYRSEFQKNLPEIFEGLQRCYVQIDGRMTAGKMKGEVLTVLHVWQAWSLFPASFLDSLEKTFLGETSEEEGIDGVPLEDDIDGFEIAI